MANGDQRGPTLHRLWPTLLLQNTLEGAEANIPDLIAFILDLEKQSEDATVNYRDRDLFTIDAPPINWLRKGVNDTVISYLREIGIDYPMRWRIQGWANVNRFGDYHDSHNHPHAYLSGTFYCQVPQAGSAPPGRGDRRPGRITFYDPRTGVNMTAVKKDPYIEPEFTVLPEPGLIMLWPAFLHHFVHPNLSEEPRISISFNINLIWQDHYLPDQG